MLLALTHRGPDARDLGYLLHKHPDRVHVASLAFGRVVVYFPAATDALCTVVMQVEVDPVGLVRSPGARQAGWSLGQYVNDRPHVASSFLSVAMARVFGTAMNARCENRPELVERPLDLEIQVPVVSAPGGQAQLEKLFVPLGYTVGATPLPLEPEFPDWGPSRYASLALRIVRPLHEVLKHLFVLLPAMDRAKHYWVGNDEVEKLLAKGEGWLADHPEKEWITRRYLKFQERLSRDALDRLISSESPGDTPDAEDTGVPVEGETTGESPVAAVTGEPDSTAPMVARRGSLHDHRLEAVVELLKKENPASVLDLGCGEGKMLARLLRDTRIPRITGMDVSSQALELAKEKTRRLGPRAKADGRLELLQGSLLYKDSRLAGHDAAVLVEVIEHLEPERLPALERSVFLNANPLMVVVTTPNREYNALFPGMAPGSLRHRDHRFEWTRAEFRDWCDRVAAEFGYAVDVTGIGEFDPMHGCPSQLADFRRIDSQNAKENVHAD